jgi:hypothetical protein
VAFLCVGQFIWTMHEEFSTLGWLGVVAALAAVALFNAGFEWLWRIGDKLERRSMPMVIPKRNETLAK